MSIVKQKPILSVCIPTYNRRDVLRELVEQLLDADTDDFLIEITDNASTDGTVEMLKEYRTDRIIVHQNKENIGGTANTLKSIFNCISKYCLYLNDRDVVDNTKFCEFIDFLKKDEYSFVYIPQSFDSKHNYKVLNKGYESLLGLGYKFHPSGMVYNSCLMKRCGFEYDIYLNSEYYDPQSAIATDLMLLDKTAFFDCGIWHERDRLFLYQNVSRSNTTINGNEKKFFFHPEGIKIDMRATLRHIILEKNNWTENEKTVLGKDICDMFFRVFLSIKAGMASEIICRHYSVKPRFITTREFLSLYEQMYKNTLQIIDELGLNSNLFDWWEKTYKKKKILTVKRSLIDDIKLPIKSLFKKG